MNGKDLLALNLTGPTGPPSCRTPLEPNLDLLFKNLHSFNFFNLIFFDGIRWSLFYIKHCIIITLCTKGDMYAKSSGLNVPTYFTNNLYE